MIKRARKSGERTSTSHMPALNVMIGVIDMIAGADADARFAGSEAGPFKRIFLLYATGGMFR